MFLHVVNVQYLNGYKLKLTFSNGAEGIIDLEPELYGEIFEPLRDKKIFQQVQVNSRTIEWPNGADFAPEFLYQHAQLIIKPQLPRYENYAWTPSAPVAALQESLPDYHPEVSENE